MEELSATLLEAKEFLSKAKQARLRNTLEHFVQSLEKEQKQLHEKQQKQKQAEAEANGESVSASLLKIPETTITSYSWDETDREVKLYFSAFTPSTLSSLTTAAQTKKPNAAIFSLRSHERRLEIRCLMANSDTPLFCSCLILYPLKNHLEVVDVSVFLELKQQSQSSSTCSSPAADGSAGDVSFQTANTAFVYPDAGSANAIASGNAEKGNCRIKIKPSGEAVAILTKTSERKWNDLLDTDDFGKPLTFGPSSDPAMRSGAAPTANVENAVAAAAGGRRYDRDDPEVQKTASLVSLMQQMYKDGDDTMKRTIEEAWKESRTVQ